MQFTSSQAHPDCVTVAHNARTLRRRSTTFSSERALHAAVEGFFTRLAIPHRSQFPVGDGAADIALELPDGRPWALLELKNETAQMDMANAADWFEQALKYRVASGLPVFLGPFFHSNMGVIDGLLYGRATPLGALSALGGRVDVGLFFLHAIRAYETRPAGWYGFQLLLRQTRVATYAGEAAPTIWPAEPLRLVDLSTAGSRKDRRL